jgi:hypothetical protein
MAFALGSLRAPPGVTTTPVTWLSYCGLPVTGGCFGEYQRPIAGVAGRSQGIRQPPKQSRSGNNNHRCDASFLF